jgi:PEP-CTERM motif
LLSSTMKSLGIAVVAFAGATLCHATLLFNQPFDGTGNAAASQNDTTGGNGNFATVYDNFTLGADGAVSVVGWTGEYFDGTQAPITAFTIQFYSDNAGAPGVSLFSASIPGNANETDLGSFGGFEAFSYSTWLGSVFNASGGTQYWISIVPDLGFPPQWGWSTGTGGDSVSYQDFLGTQSLIPVDEALSLSDTPEPLSLGLMGFGLAGMGLAKFRRRRA